MTEDQPQRVEVRRRQPRPDSGRQGRRFEVRIGLPRLSLRSKLLLGLAAVFGLALSILAAMVVAAVGILAVIRGLVLGLLGIGPRSITRR